MLKTEVEQQFVMRIAAARRQCTGGRVAVGIDGRCGAGKSTIAASLGALLGASIVHMDDFFLPNALRSEARLNEAGGNVHYERFLTEVAPFLRTGEAFSYGIFDCSVRRITGRREIPAGDLVIVEGSYALHPLYGALYDVRAFVTVAASVQQERLRERSGEAMLARFQNEWIPMEEHYFLANRLPLAGDLVIDTTE